MAHFPRMTIDVNLFRARVFRSRDGRRSDFDMTPDGRILPPPPSGIPITAKASAVALLVAVGVGAIGVAAIALWVAMTLVPIALVAAGVAYGVFRFQRWRANGGLGFSATPARPRPPGRWDRG